MVGWSSNDCAWYVSGGVAAKAGIELLPKTRRRHSSPPFVSSISCRLSFYIHLSQSVRPTDKQSEASLAIIIIKIILLTLCGKQKQTAIFHRASIGVPSIALFNKNQLLRSRTQYTVPESHKFEAISLDSSKKFLLFSRYSCLVLPASLPQLFCCYWLLLPDVICWQEAACLFSRLLRAA